MNMYTLMVMGGEELRIRDALMDMGIPAYAPQEPRMIRTGGCWVQRTYIMFRGYVFLVASAIPHIYYQVRRLPGVLKWLELHAGAATALLPAEEDMIRRCCSEGNVLSHVRRDDEGLLAPVDGLLKWYSDHGYTVIYDLHARRAIVGNPLSVLPNQVIKLSFDFAQ